MCGRYASTKSSARLAAEFDAAEFDAVDATGDDAPEADYNVAPTKSVFAVVDRHPRLAEEDGRRDPSRTERSVRVMRWGLVPKWADGLKIGNRFINARAESVADRPAFRDSFRYRRCLLPADGWFEWQRAEGRVQPFFMTPGDGSSVALAGIWAVWRDPAGPDDQLPWVTCSVVTTSAVGRFTEVHERMPLVLSPRVWSRWLDPDAGDVRDLLSGPGSDVVAELEMRPVDRTVNDVRNNGPELLERASRD